MEAALVELGEIGREVDASTETLVHLAEDGLDALAAAPPRLEEARDLFRRLLEQAGGGDLLTQRLARCRRLLEGGADTRADAHLLSGPTSAGLDQDAADRLFAGA